jgi:hypothetical protein
MQRDRRDAVFDSVFIEAGKATALLCVAGFFHVNKRTEIVRFEGGNELVVGFADLDAKSGAGGSPCGANRPRRPAATVPASSDALYFINQ